jgi:hypothetical protein
VRKFIFLCFSLMFISGCLKTEPTIQKLIDLEFGGKQLSYIEDRLSIKPIRIDDTPDGKAYEYEIQSCEVILFTDRNENITYYEFPISAKCPFVIKDQITLDSRNFTLKSLLQELSEYSVIFSTECVRSCGNSHDPSHLNYVEFDGARVINFSYFRFVFVENDGIKIWKEIVKNDLDRLEIDSLNSLENIVFWYENSEKYSELGRKYWGNDSPVSITTRRK